MSDFVDKVCPSKHAYVAPAIQVVRLEAQKLLVGSSGPTGTGEDFEWENSISGPFDIRE